MGVKVLAQRVHDQAVSRTHTHLGLVVRRWPRRDKYRSEKRRPAAPDSILHICVANLQVGEQLCGSERALGPRGGCWPRRGGRAANELGRRVRRSDRTRGGRQHDEVLNVSEQRWLRGEKSTPCLMTRGRGAH